MFLTRLLFLVIPLCIKAVFAESTESVATPEPFCEQLSFARTPFTVCTFNIEYHTLKLFHSNPKGVPYQHFNVLAASLKTNKQTLIFAMNAGMYHANRDPVGLYIENGIERSRINRNEGPGNFHLLPNGVFYVQGNAVGVLETEDYLASDIQPDFATQSGPMLVIDGKLHPRFIKDGTSRKIRNGVGVSDDGKTVVFALSEERVNFYDFGSLFRDHFGIDNALFLDGSISRMYVHAQDRNDPGRAMGPIVGVVENMPESQLDDELMLDETTE